MANHLKLTPELQEQIRLAVMAGNYLETAAAFAGISRTTLWKWLRRGQRAKAGAFREFADVMEQAMAQAEVAGIAGITRAGEKEWTALAWRLERRYPHKWGRRQRLDVDLGAEEKPDAATDEAALLTQIAEAVVGRRNAERQTGGTGAE